jgi:hypothetical protein
MCSPAPEIFLERRRNLTTLMTVGRRALLGSLSPDRLERLVERVVRELSDRASGPLAGTA